MVLISDDISGFQPAGTRRTGLGTLLSDVFNQAAATVAAAAPPPPPPASTWGANGLDTVTGWANGVVSDGVGGYTYNGQAVNSDGSLRDVFDTTRNYGNYPGNQDPAAANPSFVDMPAVWPPLPPPPSFEGRALGGLSAPAPPPDYTAYSLDFPKYNPIQQMPDYANRIGPNYQPAARPTAPTAPDPRIAQSFAGLTNPANSSYPAPGIPTDQLGRGDNAWDFTKQAIGDVAGPIGKALTPITKTYGYAGEGGKALAGMAGSAATGDIVGPTAGRNAYNATTEDWNPLAKALADTAVNPVNYLGPAAGKLLVKGSGILPTIGRNLVDQGGIKMALGATVGSYGGQKLAEKAGAGQGVQQAASLIGGLTGGVGVLAGPKIAKAGVRAADRTAVGASNRFMEPAGGAMGKPITAGMATPVPNDFRGLIQGIIENPDLSASLGTVMRRHGVPNVEVLFARAMESTPEGIALQKDIMAAAEPHMPPPVEPPSVGSSAMAEPPRGSNIFTPTQDRLAAEGVTGRETLGRTGPTGAGAADTEAAAKVNQKRIDDFHKNATIPEQEAMGRATTALNSNVAAKMTEAEKKAAIAERFRLGSEAERKVWNETKDATAANAARKAAMEGQIIPSTTAAELNPGDSLTIAGRIRKAEMEGVINSGDAIAAHEGWARIQSGAKTIERNQEIQLRRVFGDAFVDNLLHDGRPVVGMGFEPTGPMLPGFDTVAAVDPLTGLPRVADVAAPVEDAAHLRSQPPLIGESEIVGVRPDGTKIYGAPRIPEENLLQTDPRVRPTTGLRYEPGVPVDLQDLGRTPLQQAGISEARPGAVDMPIREQAVTPRIAPSTERGTTPNEHAPGASTPTNLIAQRDAALAKFTAADEAASAAEREAVGKSKAEWRGRKEGPRVSSAQGIKAQDKAWTRELNKAPNQAAAVKAAALRAEANAAKAELDALAGQFKPEGVGALPGTGEMRTTADITPGNDLVLRPQTAADVDLGVTPLLGESRSVAVARTAEELKSARQKAWDVAVDIINLPRAFKAGFDMSASLRQALPLGLSHPDKWVAAFEAQAKSITSQEAFDQIINTIHTRPLAGLAEKSGLFLASKVGAHEELFATRLAGKVWGLKATERGYVAMLDHLRANVFDSTVEGWMKQGVEPTSADLKRLAEFINHATGRGTGELLDRAGNALSLGFFAPRYWASKPQMFADVFMGTPLVRAEAAKTVAAWVGTMSTLGGLAYLAGGKVGINPLAGDFGQVGGKDYSFDLTGGMATEGRALARVALGRTTDSSGDTISADRLDIVGRYGRGKLSPSAALAIDLLAGKDYNGNPATLKALPGVGWATWNAVGNLFMQDAYKAYQKELTAGQRWGALDLPSADKLSFPAFLKVAASALASALGTPPRVDVPSEYDRRLLNDPEFGTEYGNLSGKQRMAAEKKYGPPEYGGEGNDKLAKIKETRLAEENAQDTAYANDPKAFRTAFGITQNEAATKAAQVNEGFHIFKDVPSDPLAKSGWPDDPNKRALAQYYAVFRMEQPTGEPDFDIQSVTMKKLEDSWTPEQKQWVEDRKITDHSPMGQKLTEDRKVIADSGYWNLRDIAWKSIQDSDPGLKKYPTYYDWKDATVPVIEKQMIAAGYSKVQAAAEAPTYVDTQTIYGKGQASQLKEARYAWLGAKDPKTGQPKNLMAAIDVVRWGYWVPSKEDGTADYIYKAMKTLGLDK